MSFSVTPPPNGAKVVVLISGAGTLLQALIDAVASDSSLPFTVAGVISDRAGAQGLERARAAGVPTAVVSIKDFPDRATWDVAVVRAIDVFSPDLVVTAGFMKLLGEPFLSRYAARTINTHPALLPSFPGAHGVRDALEYGVKVTGASVIFVDDGNDSGPVVAQRAVDVLPGDDEETLHERIKVVERQLVVDVVTDLTRYGWSVDGRNVTIPGPR